MRRFGFAGAIELAFLCVGAGAARADGPALTFAVDASQAAQRVYHVKATLPATPGAFTFVYPEWIPG